MGERNKRQKRKQENKQDHDGYDHNDGYGYHDNGYDHNDGYGYHDNGYDHNDGYGDTGANSGYGDKVLCPGKDQWDYCDCDWDCGNHPYGNRCDCEDAIACCADAANITMINAN